MDPHSLHAFTTHLESAAPVCNSRSVAFRRSGTDGKFKLLNEESIAVMRWESRTKYTFFKLLPIPHVQFKSKHRICFCRTGRFGNSCPRKSMSCLNLHKHQPPSVMWVCQVRSIRLKRWIESQGNGLFEYFVAPGHQDVSAPLLSLVQKWLFWRMAGRCGVRLGWGWPPDRGCTL